MAIRGCWGIPLAQVKGMESMTSVPWRVTDHSYEKLWKGEEGRILRELQGAVSFLLRLKGLEHALGLWEGAIA